MAGFAVGAVEKNNLLTKNLIVGNGLVPPKKIPEITKENNPPKLKIPATS